MIPLRAEEISSLEVIENFIKTIFEKLHLH
jgi:hypothetical protein